MKDIFTGIIKNTSGKKIAYTIKNGMDNTTSLKANSEWATYYFELCEYCDKKGIDYNSLNIEHDHWNWAEKAKDKNTPDYEWFYFLAEDKIQGVTIVYHPKNSRFDDKHIIYVDYVAIAPWNKAYLHFTKEYSGIGTLMIKKVNAFLKLKLSYREGFSLHSLPGATTYYEHIGMTSFGPDKYYHNLLYYEMEKKLAKEFING